MKMVNIILKEPLSKNIHNFEFLLGSRLKKLMLLKSCVVCKQLNGKKHSY